MSIIIQGMDMPKSCRYCKFNDCADCLVLYAKGEKAMLGNWSCNDKERPPFCPLIELPPHGEVKTNADRIRSMTDEELVEFLSERKQVLEWTFGDTGISFNTLSPRKAKELIAKWLKEEAQDGT